MPSIPIRIFALMAFATTAVLAQPPAIELVEAKLFARERDSSAKPQDVSREAERASSLGRAVQAPKHEVRSAASWKATGLREAARKQERIRSRDNRMDQPSRAARDAANGDRCHSEVAEHRQERRGNPSGEAMHNVGSGAGAVERGGQK